MISMNSDFRIENNVLKKYLGSDKNVTIPDGIVSIGEYAFSDCTDLINITIPSSVTSIGNEAFVYCKNLTNVIIPNGITYIDNNAFSFCENLNSVTIPNSITFIGYGIFYGCKNLNEIIFEYCTDLEILKELVTQINEDNYISLKRIGLKKNRTIKYKTVKELIKSKFDLSIFDNLIENSPNENPCPNDDTSGLIDINTIPNISTLNKDTIITIEMLLKIGKSKNEIFNFLNISQQDIQNTNDIIHLTKISLKLGKSLEDVSTYLEISIDILKNLIKIEDIFKG